MCRETRTVIRECVAISKRSSNTVENSWYPVPLWFGAGRTLGPVALALSVGQRWGLLTLHGVDYRWNVTEMKLVITAGSLGSPACLSQTSPGSLRLLLQSHI
jgi:hypothetical protein